MSEIYILECCGEMLGGSVGDRTHLIVYIEKENSKDYPLNIHAWLQERHVTSITSSFSTYKQPSCQDTLA
jgi:hypothetical protein